MAVSRSARMLVDKEGTRASSAPSVSPYLSLTVCLLGRNLIDFFRPDRVTGAGFWKPTGTGRPVYSSEGTRCIGLKKSLVFCRGRAAEGVETDWTMHEFRLPSPNRPSEKRVPIDEAWAICKIFKKTNSMAQRALSDPWMSPVPDPLGEGLFSTSMMAPSQQEEEEESSMSYHLDFESISYKHSNLINCSPSPLPISSAQVTAPSFLFSQP